MRITGSATYAIEPGYTYFSWHSTQPVYKHTKVYIDGKRVPEESLLQPKLGWRQDKRDRIARLLLAPIPPGAKTLKIEILKGEHRT